MDGRGISQGVILLVGTFAYHPHKQLTYLFSTGNSLQPKGRVLIHWHQVGPVSHHHKVPQDPCTPPLHPGPLLWNSWRSPGQKFSLSRTHVHQGVMAEGSQRFESKPQTWPHNDAEDWQLHKQAQSLVIYSACVIWLAPYSASALSLEKPPLFFFFFFFFKSEYWSLCKRIHFILTHYAGNWLLFIKDAKAWWSCQIHASIWTDLKPPELPVPISFPQMHISIPSTK